MSNSSIPETLTFPTDASHATHLEPRSRLTPHRPCNPQVLFPDSALCPYVEARPVPERFRPSVRSSGRMLTLAVVSIQEWEIVNERTDCREAASLKQVKREQSRTKATEAHVEESVNRGKFPVPAPGTSLPLTPARGSTDILTQGMMGLSPMVVMASRAQRSGKTFTEVYADHVRLQDEYAKKCAEYDCMSRTLAWV